MFKWVITAFGNMAADKLWFLKMDEFLSTRLPPLPDYGMTPGTPCCTDPYTSVVRQPERCAGFIIFESVLQRATP